MSEQRETKTVETPIGKQKVVLNAWITGREKRQIRNIFLKDASVTPESLKGEVSGSINMAKIAEEAENKALEIVIISIDGKTENILDAILDMRVGDYSFIIKEVNKVTKEEAFLD